MKAYSAQIACFVFFLLTLSACGVFEIGIETPTALPPSPPPATTLPATNPAPPATATPFPGQLQPGQPVRITQLDLRDAANGWGIGQVETDLNDHLLFTNDGGRTWQDRTPPAALLNPPAEGLRATAYFGAEGLAWALFSPQSPQGPLPEKQITWRTADDGLSWQPGGDLPLVNFQAEYFIPDQFGFTDEQHGWLLAHVGAGMSHDYIVAFATNDGGQSWQRIIDMEKNSQLMSCQKTGLAFSTTANGWLAGNCPGLFDHLFLYTTSDGGQGWQLVNLPPPTGQPADLFSSAKALCGVPQLVRITARSTRLSVRCDLQATGRTLAWLYAGPADGALEARPLPLPYGALQFLNADEGWLVGAQTNDPAAPGEIYHTLDGGLTWTPIIATAWQGSPEFIDSNNGWVVARANAELALVHTTNGGRLWEVLSPVIGE